jgi:hypothetical protein
MSTEAFAFTSDRTLDEMYDLLNSAAPPSWRGGDNEHWGEYLVTSTELARLRIFRDGPRYVVDISRVEEAPGALHQAVAMVQARVLPLVGAANVEPHTGWE